MTLKRQGQCLHSGTSLSSRGYLPCTEDAEHTTRCIGVRRRRPTRGTGELFVREEIASSLQELRRSQMMSKLCWKCATGDERERITFSSMTSLLGILNASTETLQYGYGLPSVRRLLEWSLGPFSWATATSTAAAALVGRPSSRHLIDKCFPCAPLRAAWCRRG